MSFAHDIFISARDSALAANSTVRVLDGNDLIVNGINYPSDGAYDHVTIDLSNATQILEYASGDGNDVVNNYVGNSVNITDGSSCTTLRTGSDVLVNVGNDSLRLVGAYDKTLNIAGGAFVGTLSPVIQVTIDGGAGDNSVFNRSANSLLDGGRGR